MTFRILELKEMFPRQPEKLKLYVQQHLLVDPSSKEEEERPAPLLHLPLRADSISTDNPRHYNSADNKEQGQTGPSLSKE